MKANPGVEQAILERKRSQPAISNRALAKAFAVHHSVVERVLRGGSSSSESSTMTADTWAFESKTRERVTTLEELIAFCKIDTGVWSIERWVCNKWEVGAVGADGRLQPEPLYQVKATMRKKQALVDARSEIEDLKELTKRSLPAAKPIAKASTKPSRLMLELNLSDAHLGKLAHTDETRGSNYDTKIAEQTYRKAFATLLDRVSGYKFDQILYVVGNDALQSDDPEGRTTAGTYVSTDGRYYKTFKIVRSMIIDNIEELRGLAREVHVKIVPGNHDSRSCFFLGDSLECYFDRHPDVVVDNEPKHRKYHRFHDVLLGFTHGHKGKHSDYPMLMATEVPTLFGETKFREIHCGHYHQLRSDLIRVREIEENHGVRVRILSALTAADGWHSAHGFVGNLRSSEAFVWSGDEGLIATAVYTEPD